MAVKKNDKLLLKRLKKQVRTLQRKEEQTRNKLRVALKKIRKLGRQYKSKLSSKMRAMKGKIAEVQSTTYIKVAADLERKLLKGIEAKSKALKLAIAKIEKKHLTKLTKGVVKKGRRVRKVKGKKASSASKMKHTRRQKKARR